MKKEDNSQATPASLSKSSIHKGHRTRLRKRYRTNGLDGFEPHEVMELLLTYSIQRKDVNEEAHALIERFGSVSAVLDAHEEELCSVKGIGPDTALFLHLLPDLFRLYALEECPTEAAMDTAEKITTYLNALFVGLTCERVYLLLFDNGMRLIDCSSVGEGNVNNVALDLCAIVERAVTKHASCAVLAHNHPGGHAIPSKEDYLITDQVAGLLDIVKIPLIEHFLVTKTLCTGILRRSRGLLRASPFTDQSGEAFWRQFYGETDI